MTGRKRISKRQAALLAVVGATALAMGSSAVAQTFPTGADADQSSAQVGGQSEGVATTAETAAPETGATIVGQGETPRPAPPNIEPGGRIDNRIESRIQNRLRTRVDRGYETGRITNPVQRSRKPRGS